MSIVSLAIPLGLYAGESSSKVEVGRRSVGISTTASPSMCAECMSSDMTAGHLKPVHDKEDTEKRRCRRRTVDGRGLFEGAYWRPYMALVTTVKRR